MSVYLEVINANVIPVIEGLSVSLCFVVGIEVLTSSFRDTVITVNFEVGNCVHLIDVKNTVK